MSTWAFEDVGLVVQLVPYKDEAVWAVAPWQQYPGMMSEPRVDAHVVEAKSSTLDWAFTPQQLN